MITDDLYKVRKNKMVFKPEKAAYNIMPDDCCFYSSLYKAFDEYEIVIICKIIFEAITQIFFVFDELPVSGLIQRLF